MRYTTIIDISEFPRVYRNENATRLYLHLVLKCGYHDEDKDVLDASIRGLAAACRMSIAAVRHALSVLQAEKLIKREGDVWIIRKWVPAATISARPKGNAHEIATAEAEKKARQKQERKEELERLRREELKQQNKTEFMLYYEGLMAKAAAGDNDAQRLVERHKATYEAHKANLNK